MKVADKALQTDKASNFLCARDIMSDCVGNEHTAFRAETVDAQTFGFASVIKRF